MGTQLVLTCPGLCQVERLVAAHENVLAAAPQVCLAVLILLHPRGVAYRPHAMSAFRRARCSARKCVPACARGLQARTRLPRTATHRAFLCPSPEERGINGRRKF